MEDSIPTTPLMALNKILPHNMHSSDLFSSEMRNQKETSLLEKKLLTWQTNGVRDHSIFEVAGMGLVGFFLGGGGGACKKNGYRRVHAKKIKVKRRFT